MSTVVDNVREQQHLARVLEVIAHRTAAAERERVKGSKELVSYRKYMWEDAALFDRAEMVQSENVALTQERAILDVRIRLKRLRMLSSSPYFGRIDFRETGQSLALPVYVGLHSLFDEDESLLIYDWRAPVSGMFYDYEVGPAGYIAPDGPIQGELLLKRQYKIEGGRMLYAFDSSLAINDDILRDTLARNTSEKMRQIVNSIQREQNAIIRSEDRKVLVVQGPAGSGKSSIAMHRAAYLLYRHRGHLSANNLLVFSPNDVFADYISGVLPELGEENIREATFDDYARSILGGTVAFEPRDRQMEFLLCGEGETYDLRAASIRFKSSSVFLEILRSYPEQLKRTDLRFQDIVLNGTLVLPGDTVEELFWEHCAHLPIAAGIERLKDRVLSRATYSSQLVERRIEREVGKVVVDRDPARLYKKLFRDPELVRRLAGDAPLPHELRDICKFTSRGTRGGELLYEDVAPVLLLKRLIDGEPRYVNIRHLIVDEAQDYTPVQFEILRRLFGDASLTVLGDLNQRINFHSGLDDYEMLVDVFGSEARDVVRLTRSYRSSWQISQFAAQIAPVSAGAQSVRRDGASPKVICSEGVDHTAAAIASEIEELTASGMASVGVVCKTAAEAARIYSKLRALNAEAHLLESESIHFHHGLVVLPVYLAKGLEFDAVILADAGSHIYGDRDRTILYTACTRALHSLTLYYTGQPSPLLPLWQDQAAADESRVSAGGSRPSPTTG